MQKRAPIGGTTAINGEFYFGGEFLPTTQLLSQSKARGIAKERKQEIEPYVWAFAPVAGQRSIFAQLSGSYGKFDRSANTFEIFVPYVSNLPAAQQEKAADLVSRYNAGERWV